MLVTESLYVSIISSTIERFFILSLILITASKGTVVLVNLKRTGLS